MTMKSHPALLAVALLLATFGGAAWGQDTASITGTVADSTGASVAGAQVTVTNAEHGLSRAATTNASGDYLFAALPIGSYDVTVASEGFKKYQVRAVKLDVAQKARLNVTLQVGAINTEVVVEGSAVAEVETQSSDLGGVVSGKEITQLQLNGRDFKQLITLVPGVSNQTGADEGSVGVAANNSFSVNGGRVEYNNWEIDGGDVLDNGSNNTLNVTPSVDSIGEFKVLTSNYGAQYGRNGSGTVEAETKSGTKAFHGDAFEFLRNDAFNAKQFNFTNVPPYKKHDFGFTIGGPVYIPGVYNQNKQKTFFFYSEEWRRELVPGTSYFSGIVAVPTMSDRGGDFSDQCPGSECPVVPALINGAPPASSLAIGQPFPNNNLSAYISNSTIANAETALIPQPNLSSGNAGSGVLDQWYLPPSEHLKFREELFKIDHNITDKVRASFRYVHDSWNQVYPTPLWTSGTSFPTVVTNFAGPGISMVARLTANVSPTLLNEFVVSYTTDHISTTLGGAWARPSGFPATFGLYPNGGGGKVPGVNLSDSLYSFAEDPGYVPNGPINSNPTFTYRDNLSKLLGGHNLQMGAYIANAHKNELPQPGTGINGLLNFSNSGSLYTTGNAYADLLLGNISSFSQQQNAFKTHQFYNIVEPYFQDDWHVTSRLTLNLGVRFSFFGTYKEKNNLAWNFDPAAYVAGASGVQFDPVSGNWLVTGNPLNGWVDCGVTPGVPAGCMKNHWWNPAPRIGFALDPFGNGKWAIRGGYGMFYEHTNGNEANTEGLEPFNKLTQTSTVSNIPGYASLVAPTSTTPLTFWSIPDKAVWPYMQQWHLDVQHDVGRRTVATLSYVGSHGIHLTRSYELNQMVPVSAAQNPYHKGQPIAGNDCNTVSIDPTSGQATATVNSQTMTGGWANNLAVACGNNSSPYLPFVGIGSIEAKRLAAGSSYNALQGLVRHSIGGLELNAAYTYGHSIDDSSDNGDFSLLNSYSLNSFRASSNFDQRQTFSLGYVYDVPFFRGTKGLANKLAGGWQWSGITLIQSGTPYSVYNKGGGSGFAPADNAGTANPLATGQSWPDLASDPKAGVVNTPQPGFGPLKYNPAAFVAPTGLTFGDAGRNILTNPGRVNFDMALLKKFSITETTYFEFRAEAFNVFNHTEFNAIGGEGNSAGGNSGAGGLAQGRSIGCYGGSNNNAGDASCFSNGSATPLFRSSGSHLPRILQLGLKFIF